MSCRNEILGICAIGIVIFYVYGNIGMIDIPRAGLIGLVIGLDNADVDIFCFYRR